MNGKKGKREGMREREGKVRLKERCVSLSVILPALFILGPASYYCPPLIHSVNSVHTFTYGVWPNFTLEMITRTFFVKAMQTKIASFFRFKFVYSSG